jgi:pyruvate dehydrogenase E2 component (dihydrolipoamide acetyltransferase)
MTELTMPKLSDSMEEGTILSWLKADGDAVAAGEELVEIETDKATMTYAAEAAGVLSILASEGETLPVGAPIAALRDGSPSDAGPAGQANGASRSPEPEPAGALPVTGAREVLRRATPLARRIAAAHGIALEQISGSGPRGRITRADVEAAAGLSTALSRGRTAAPSATAPPRIEGDGTAQRTRSVGGEPDGVRGTTRRPLTRAQQVVARRMAESKATVPHFQVETEVRLDLALALREELRAVAGDRPSPSVNDLIVKAAALALREHPLANGSFCGDALELHERINVGVAVATDDGLVVPTVFDADRASLGRIAAETRRLAELARNRAIDPAALDGGTFTVSNLGMFGMTAITPVVNPPQAAILGVGAARAGLERVGGDIVDRTRLTLRLSCDHRILYGADAARFLARIRELLEAPLALTL